MQRGDVDSGFERVAWRESGEDVCFQTSGEIATEYARERDLGI